MKVRNLLAAIAEPRFSRFDYAVAVAGGFAAAHDGWLVAMAVVVPLAIVSGVLHAYFNE